MCFGSCLYTIWLFEPATLIVIVVFSAHISWSNISLHAVISEYWKGGILYCIMLMYVIYPILSCHVLSCHVMSYFISYIIQYYHIITSHRIASHGNDIGTTILHSQSLLAPYMCYLGKTIQITKWCYSNTLLFDSFGKQKPEVHI